MGIFTKLTAVGAVSGMMMVGPMSLGGTSLESSGITSVAPSPTHSAAKYTFDRVREGLSKKSAESSRAYRAATAGSSSLLKPYVPMKLEGESPALIDTTLIDKAGASAAISRSFVDLSWTSHANRKYVIYRDGVEIASQSDGSFRDTRVVPAKRYEYQIVTISTDGSELGAGESSAIGYPVTIPSSAVDARGAAALNALAASTSRAVVRYKTFIPQKRLASPAAGCGSYSGSKYEFGGDNRSFNPDGGSSRGYVNANIRFGDNAGLFGSSKQIGATHIYRKSDGKLVAQKTASSSGMWAKQLGADRSSVDIRIQMDLGNPFCTKFAPISGVVSLTVNQNGTYRTISGTHKQMPSHEIYVSRPVGNWAAIHRSSAKDPMCLFGAACPTITLSGLYGSY